MALEATIWWWINLNSKFYRVLSDLFLPTSLCIHSKKSGLDLKLPPNSIESLKFLKERPLPERESSGKMRSKLKVKRGKRECFFLNSRLDRSKNSCFQNSQQRLWLMAFVSYSDPPLFESRGPPRYDRSWSFNFRSWNFRLKPSGVEYSNYKYASEYTQKEFFHFSQKKVGNEVRP